MSSAIERLIVRNAEPYDPQSHCKLGRIFAAPTQLPSVTTLDIGRIGRMRIIYRHFHLIPDVSSDVLQRLISQLPNVRLLDIAFDQVRRLYLQSDCLFSLMIIMRIRMCWMNGLICCHKRIRGHNCKHCRCNIVIVRWRNDWFGCYDARNDCIR